MSRIYHHFEKWEEIKEGMWRVVRGRNRKEYLTHAIALMKHPVEFKQAMLRASELWRHSCDAHLTGGFNRQAWIGHAGCCVATGSPEDVTREAWHYLTQAEQDRANADADEVLKLWDNGVKRMPKRPLGMNVLEAARQRVAWAFDTFEKIYVSFSGGKDSTVMLHLVMEEAKKRKQKVGVMFIDWECQFTATIDHIRNMFKLYEEYIIPYWIAVPIRTWNGCSQYETEWVAWDEAKQSLWVREKDHMSIGDKNVFPFYFQNMMFEEFVPLFGKWFSEGKSCGCFVGIRTDESLNRFRTVARDKPMMDGKPFTTNIIDDVWNIYPIYDWETEDDWTYSSVYGKPYNTLYDLMYQAGMTIHQMRIDEPFGDTQRIGLWLYQVIEPKLWAKMTLRVAGANSGAIYSNERGNIMGLHTVSLPNGHTWESFSMLLLQTMPPATSEHYKNKIARYLKWYQTRGYPDGIPDAVDAVLEQKGLAPSWRRLCKALLRNDFWCKTIGFSPTKSQAYEKYMALMRKRRGEWNILPSKEEHESVCN